MNLWPLPKFYSEFTPPHLKVFGVGVGIGIESGRPSSKSIPIPTPVPMILPSA
ncbi:hypothetical protein D3OALGA1CA_2068 [Olavius algarvensis associated proteobacterium Delta 3]|nr:hypothetical protein D3OALGA1CA_2068 [Olavius algarvensis associated proteobacterium Delta 3]CAB5120640.1 hypothetical protein D3OALGB2SA_2963 [Olavius algarvensis associated proteobacterium Delta 3]